MRAEAWLRLRLRLCLLLLWLLHPSLMAPLHSPLALALPLPSSPNVAPACCHHDAEPIRSEPIQCRAVARRIRIESSRSSQTISICAQVA